MSKELSKFSEPSEAKQKKPNSGKRKTPPQSISSVTPSKMQKTVDDTNEGSIVGTNLTSKWQNNDLEDDEDETIKFKSLEHHAVRFAPPYEPHGVPIIHKGEERVLEPEQEEIANFWAQALDTEFAEKQTVRDNFEKAFLKALGPHSGIHKLDD